MILLLEIYSITIGQALAALMPTSYAAEMLCPFVLVIFTLFCGVTIRPDALGHFWWIEPTIFRFEV